MTATAFMITPETSQKNEQKKKELERWKGKSEQQPAATIQSECCKFGVRSKTSVAEET